MKKNLEAVTLDSTVPSDASGQSFKILNLPEAEPEELVRIGHGLWRQQNNYALNPCAYCASKCCSLRVDLTIIEALRVSYTLVLPLLDFLVVRQPTVKHPAKLCSPFLILNEPSNFAFRQNVGHCFHLTRPGELRSRCGIYALRPAICRLYPFSMEQNGILIEMGNEQHCPVNWMQNDETRERARADFNQFQEDYALEKQWLAKWNTRPYEDRALETFIDFLMNEVGPTLGYNPDVFSALPERGFGRKLFSYNANAEPTGSNEPIDDT